MSIAADIISFQAVCIKLGLNTGECLLPGSIKRKFLVSSLPDDKVCVTCCEVLLIPGDKRQKLHILK